MGVKLVVLSRVLCYNYIVGIVFGSVGERLIWG